MRRHYPRRRGDVRPPEVHPPGLRRGNAHRAGKERLHGCEATAAPSAFIDLEKAGYDQLPCGSIWADEKNFGALVPFCRKRIGRERLKGFLMAPWLATLEANRVKLMKAVDIAAAAFTTAE